MVTAYQPEIRKVLENGLLKAGEFQFVMRDADGNQVGTIATNDETGTVEFEALEFTEAGEYTYTITEVAGSAKNMKYSDEVITLKVTVVEQGDTLVATAEYLLNGEPIKAEDGAEVAMPTITNRYKSVGVKAQKRTRLYDEKGNVTLGETISGATYGLWMVNPDGADIYMGSQVSDKDGWLYYELPLTEGAVYYFKEEGPAPAGHLIDPYPTDYFSLVIGEDEYSLTYYGSYDEAVENKG